MNRRLLFLLPLLMLAVAAIHRGFSWFERTPYRNSPMWEFPIRLKAAFPELEPIWLSTETAEDQILLLSREQLAL